MDIQYYAYIFLGIVFILRSLEFTENRLTFGSLLVSGAVIYYLYNYNLSKETADNKKFRKEVLGEEKLENNKLKFIRNEPTVLKLYYQIKNLKKYNSRTIEESLEHLNNFYRLIRDLSIGVVYPTHHIQVAQEQRHKALNLLKSLTLNVPINHGSLVENKIDKIIERIDNITYAKLKQINNDNTDNWKKDLDITQNIYYMDGPQPKDPALNKNFEIY